MSFGYSVGDIIAIAGVIERIVNEVKAYKSAPLHFQRLAIELGFLSSVCKQVFDLRPSLPDEIQYVERIRAIAMQCLAPLQDFEARMAKYENTLGTDAGSRVSFINIKTKRRKIRDFGKRLHWSAIEQHDVDKLRAILTSEILAINTLLTMAEWNSLKSQNLVNRSYATRLQNLIQTTNSASADIMQFLIDAKSASQHLEQLIVSGNLTQKEQIQVMTMIGNNTCETQKAVHDLSLWQQQHTLRLKDAVGDVSKQIVKLFSFKEYMEDWVRKIVQYCKDIIAMVERNTQILLSLHGMITKLSLMLSQSNVHLPILEFENPFGHNLALPYQMCDTWDGLNRLLLCMFFNKPGLKLVQAGRFLVTNTATNRIIKPTSWASTVAPGDKVFMSMVLERMGRRRKSCPRCGEPLPAMSRSGAICKSCQLWSFIADNDNTAFGISQSSHELEIPMPPPETLRLQTSSWSGSWTSDYVREQARLRLPILAKKGHRVQQFDGQLNNPPLELADEIEESFRRVHVIPFQGDPLEALIKIGQRCRDLMVQFSSHIADPLLSLSSAPFEPIFADILTDMEEIRSSGINPLLELAIRQGSDVKRQIVLSYIEKTATILAHAPLGDRFAQSQISHLIEWLMERPKAALTYPRTGQYDAANHPLRGTKYWQYNLLSRPFYIYGNNGLAPENNYTTALHKPAMSIREELKSAYSAARRVAHGHHQRTYGTGDVGWEDVATHWDF
ncbi:hypothetical protein F5Y19DRAFT_475545 [Xylariaceae sp. FL1651]|nr:hypothetical protein F5Y19DRAFT_475545 [Xylariaceae sp. FL1651]